MPQPDSDLYQYARRVACRVALEAWRAIEPLYLGSYRIENKPEGPSTDADQQADALIVERLQELFPARDYGYLTEESEDRSERLGRDRVWIIDPIDGTKEFINGTGNFAIQIGLVERQADGFFHPVAAAVFRPIAGAMYSAVRGGGAVRQHVGEVEIRLLGPTDALDADLGELGPAQPLRVSTRDRIERMRSVVSNSIPASRLIRLIESLDLEDYWRIGSLGIKVCTIAEGGAELYINLGGGRTKEWDACAPHLVLEEAGGRLTDLEGRPIVYNQTDVYHRRGLMATNSQAHEALCELVQRFLEDEALKK